MTFDLTYGGERLVYLLDYSDSQTMDRPGSNAVSGTFVVDAVIEALESTTAITGQLSAYIARDGVRTEVDTSAMEERIVPHDWDLDPDCRTLYFSTELFGPRYGCWVTEYALAALDLQTGQLRRVELMPGPGFRLSPCGRYAVYGHRDRVLIVPSCPWAKGVGARPSKWQPGQGRP